MSFHIVIALNSCRGRTIGSYALRRAEYLAKYFRVTLISDSLPDVIPENIEYRLVSPKQYNYLRRYCHVPNDLSFAFSVRKSLEELYLINPFDFILCHSYTLTKFVGQYFNKKQGTHFGMFMHGHIFARPKGTYDSRVTAFYKWIAPSCYKEADLIFALSPAQKKLAIQAGADSDKVLITPNGIDAEDIGIKEQDVKKSRLFDRKRKELSILYVGRFGIEKGVHILLHACHQLMLKKAKFILTLVGGGPQEKEIINLAKNLDLMNNIEFVGSVNRYNLGEYYINADVLCVPSLSEPLGNVILEGMIAGCPVVGSNIEGIPFIIEDNVNGYLVPPGDPNKLSEVIGEIANDRKRSKIIAEAGRKMVKQKFVWSKINNYIYSKIDELLNS